MIKIHAIKPVKFKVGRGTYENLPQRYIDGFIWFTTDTGKLYIDAKINDTVERTLINPDMDWSLIKNKPNNIVAVYYDTTQNWNSQVDLIGQANTLYIYTDGYEENGVTIPKIKIGDGLAYLIDLPFLGEEIVEVVNNHINNSTIHVSNEDRIRWDNKVRAYHSTIDNETIVFTTN